MRVELPTRRGTLIAVDDVSFPIAPGEVLGVVGESGAGKSLTGAAIIGLLEPPLRIAGGSIVLAGRRIDNLPYEAMRRIRGKEIGAIFQDPLTSLNPLYTIGQQLVETIRTHLDLGAAAARERALALLREVGIAGADERIDHYPHQFSGGMRQRVVIALALAANPRLIIADEPTTALDVSIQAQIIALLKRLSRDHGTAIMLVTHDMGVIAETAHRVAVMYAGRIVEIGPVREIVDEPQPPLHARADGLDPAHRRAGAGGCTQIDGTMPRLERDPAGLPVQPALPARRSTAAAASGPSCCRPAATAAACWLYAAAMPAEVGRCLSASTLLEVDDLTSPFRRLAAGCSSGCCSASRARCVKAVDGVSFTIGRGETFALVGESGCGKSTVARCLVGLYRPTRRQHRLRRRRPRVGCNAAQDRGAAAPAHADDLPGPLCQPQPALARAPHRRRAAA